MRVLLFTAQKQLEKSCFDLLKKSQTEAVIVVPTGIQDIEKIYEDNFDVLVTDDIFAFMPDKVWMNILDSLSSTKKVIIISDVAKGKTVQKTEKIFWLIKPRAEDVVRCIQTEGMLPQVLTHLSKRKLDYYFNKLPLKLLRENGAISLLTINSSSFRKIGVDFGPEAYDQLQEVFQALLEETWGKSGYFRNEDKLVRKSEKSNVYYIFLEQSRITNSIPSPGVLEKLADRLLVNLQNSMWEELFKNKKDRRLPDCISVVPKFSIGHSTVLYNPCVDENELLDQLIESSFESSRVQMRRLEERQKEFIQCLIQGRDILYPFYQGVFTLPNLTQEAVELSQQEKSIKPLQPYLYGFESLIRVKKDTLKDRVLDDHLFALDSKFLRPDVMFGLASNLKISLELDQVCLSHGVQAAKDLPGLLMVNILPRNLYNIDRIISLFGSREDIVFELSESEALNNFELMNTVRDFLKSRNLKIAADDFGKGHASLERIIKIRPDIIKLDRSLVENIHLDESKIAFVTGVVKAAKHVGTLVLGEGVELWEEAEVLKGIGVDLIQGFLCHRPCEIETIMTQLNSVEDNNVESLLPRLNKLRKTA